MPEVLRPEGMVERPGDGAPNRAAGSLVEHGARTSARARRVAAHTGRLAAPPDALELWTRSAPGARQARFTREHIAETAVRVADGEGLDAVSMRRLAAELGAGTMTLYHYVRTKQELLALVCDQVVGEVVLPPSEPVRAGWRCAITAIAHRSRAALLRHPWMLDITGDLGIGPNSVRRFDQTLAAAAQLAGTVDDQLDLVSAVDEYVVGYCLGERRGVAGPRDPRAEPQMVAYVEGLLRAGGYPRLSELAGTDGTPELWARIDRHARSGDRFERNLGRLLDGFEPADR